jgi:hypothetical protein
MATAREIPYLFGTFSVMLFILLTIIAWGMIG